MLTSRLLNRLQATCGFRVVVFALSAGVFVFSLHLAWLAFSNPVELEIREGSIWILALAKRAGVDLYDTSRVAFVNMNHGPLDPILKGWITRCAPTLPGHMVTRAFVLLTPIFLFAAAYTMTRRQMGASLLAAGTLFLVLCQMSMLMFVGRSDATAICGLALCGALAHRLLVTRHGNWSSRSYIVIQLALGAASSAVFLASSRYAPIPAALQVVVLSTQLGGAATGAPATFLQRLRSGAKHLGISSALYLAGFAAVWLPVFFLELHGDLGSYYRHFFGFFSAKSGWGTFPGASFRLLPDELVTTRTGALLLCLALVLLGFYRLRRQTGELVAWVTMLSAAWMAVAYGYFKNQGGGGLHYFFAFFTFAWIFILHVSGRRRRWGGLTQLSIVGIVALSLPFRALLAEETLLANGREQARAFRQDVAHATYGHPVFGEENHLFKLLYQGEVVDTGDSTAAIAASGYFGQAFTRTYEAYARDLMARPPKFVLGGLIQETNAERIMSPVLQELLRSRYTLRLIARGSCLTDGNSQALFERND